MGWHYSLKLVIFIKTTKGYRTGKRCMNSSTLTRIIISLTLAAGFTQVSYARRSKLSPAKVKQIKKTNKSFKVCRKDALNGLKNGTISKRKFGIELKTCNERFPGASLYIACKKSVVRKAKAKNVAPGKALRGCKKFMVAASFDPDSPVPFFVHNSSLYFSGVGLNKTIPVSNLEPPNFDCENMAPM